jgi:tetratricopeptide (TPR) repeat protein
MRSPVSTFVLAAAMVWLASACTPQAALIASLVPDGTLGVLLGNLEHVSHANRERVVALERRGAWKELAAFAGSELGKDPANADWWLIAGYARSQMREHAAAAEAYAQVIRLEPDNPAGWHLLAQTHRAAGEPHRAVNALNNAVAALRDSALTWYLLGESYSDLKRYAEAAAAYESALKIEQRFPAAWFALGSAYLRLGRGADARAAAAQLEKLDPKLAARLRESLSESAASAR